MAVEKNLRELFQLRQDITYLNHGSFGACPTPVFQTYQHWQAELEKQPVEFLVEKAFPLLDDARNALAEFLHTEPAELVFFSNPTTAVNMVARNLHSLMDAFSGNPMQEGDHVVSSDHEYGAMDRTWNYYAQRDNYNYSKISIPVPIQNKNKFLNSFWNRLPEKTRVIFISHITSPTAILFPIKEICQQARQQGILTIVDGAHAPGQISLNLSSIGADIYAGACHKWMMAPKGSAFLFVRKELQPALDPLVISWGYHSDPGFGSSNPFADYHEWQGTRDISPFLTIPAAIHFFKEYQWEKVRIQCHKKAVQTFHALQEITGEPPICPEDWFAQMFAILLPPAIDTAWLKNKLYHEHHIEVPVYNWNGFNILRVSIQGYNTQNDMNHLLDVLRALL